MLPFLHTHSYLTHFCISWYINTSSFITLIQELSTLPGISDCPKNHHISLNHLNSLQNGPAKVP